MNPVSKFQSSIIPKIFAYKQKFALSADHDFLIAVFSAQKMHSKKVLRTTLFPFIIAQYPTHRLIEVVWDHRRRTKTEEKAKVVASVWWEEYRY